MLFNMCHLYIVNLESLSKEELDAVDTHIVNTCADLEKALDEFKNGGKIDDNKYNIDVETINNIRNTHTNDSLV